MFTQLLHLFLIYDFCWFHCWFTICVFRLHRTLRFVHYLRWASKILFRLGLQRTRTSPALVLCTRTSTSGPATSSSSPHNERQPIAASPSCSSSSIRGAVSYATYNVDFDNVDRGPFWGRRIRYRPRTSWFERRVWRSSRYWVYFHFYSLSRRAAPACAGRRRLRLSYSGVAFLFHLLVLRRVCLGKCNSFARVSLRLEIKDGDERPDMHHLVVYYEWLEVQMRELCTLMNDKGV